MKFNLLPAATLTVALVITSGVLVLAHLMSRAVAAPLLIYASSHPIWVAYGPLLIAVLLKLPYRKRGAMS